MGSSLPIIGDDGFSLSVKKPKAIIKGERGEVFSLPFAIGDRLLTLGEEAEGVGFSPWVKKPEVRR